MEDVILLIFPSKMSDLLGQLWPGQEQQLSGLMDLKKIQLPLLSWDMLYEEEWVGNAVIEGKKNKERQSFSLPDGFLAWLWKKRGSYKCILPLIIKIKSGSRAEGSGIMRLPQASGKEAVGKVRKKLEKLCRKGSFWCAQPSRDTKASTVGRVPSTPRAGRNPSESSCGTNSSPSSVML